MILLSKRTTAQFIKFCIIGVLNAIVHLSIYYLLLWFNVYYLIANGVAFILSVLNSYFWNKRFTFTESTTTVFMIVKLYASYGITTLMGTGLLYLLVEIVGLGKYVSPIINIGITTGINFILNKYFVFKDRG
ncbi:sugar translocase [Spirochaetia bacterium]|nr:sugar translocase [Spirochaetia bacterium]